MFDIGFMELLLVALIGLIVLGPERLPKAAYNFGLIIARIRRSFSQVQQELEREVRMQELKEKMQNPYATFMDDEPQMTSKQQRSGAHHSSTDDEIAADLADPIPPTVSPETAAASKTSEMTVETLSEPSNRPFISPKE